jgi:hypothetical protein
MKKLLAATIALTLLLAACSGDSGSQVASLDDTPVAQASDDDPSDEGGDDTEAILEFAQCMRDNGVPDFEDPDVSADGSVEFQFRGLAEVSDVDPDTMRGAFEACRETLDGVAIGPGSIDRTEIEDTLYEFAACMRDNGIDMPDPDFSSFGTPRGEPGEGGGPFGGAIDPDDPEFQKALEACEDVFAGGFRFGGPGARGSS